MALSGQFLCFHNSVINVMHALLSRCESKTEIKGIKISIVIIQKVLRLKIKSAAELIICAISFLVGTSMSDLARVDRQSPVKP